MNSAAINDAIVSHRAWVMRLKTYLGGVNTERFNPDEVTDSRACEFGRWLTTCTDCFQTPQSKREIEELHDNFHKLAGDIAILIQDFDQPSDLEPYFVALEELSRELIHRLMQERQ